MTAKPKRPVTGAVEPRLHNKFLKGPSRGDEVAQLAEDIGLPLLPWQRFVLNDMLTVDKNKQFVRKTNLVICARQNGKTHLARMRILAGLFLFNERNHVVISSARSMALTTFREVANAIDDIRDGHGEQPTIIVWENVPGVLSTVRTASKIPQQTR